MSITDEEIEMEATRSWYENSSLKPPFGFLHGFDIGFRSALQNKVSDPATEQSTANWQKVGDKDKFMNEVRGGEDAEEKIKQRILTAYYDGFNQAHYSHVHPEICPPKECESAGKEYMIKKEEHINSDLKEYASIVNERKDNAVHDAAKLIEWIRENWIVGDNDLWRRQKDFRDQRTDENLYLEFIGSQHK